MTDKEALLAAIEYIDRSGVAEHDNTARQVIQHLEAMLDRDKQDQR